METLSGLHVREMFALGHQALGYVAMVAALCALLARKGGRAHRAWGTCFLLALLYSISGAMVLEIQRSLPFTYALAGACGCSLLVGFVAARQRAAWPGPLAIALMAATAICGAWFLVVPGLRPDPGNLALGLGMMALAGTDVLTWRARRPRHWWFVHMRHMLSAFALALVAFSGAALKMLPEDLRYWWPIVAGVLLIGGWTGYFQMKLEDRRRSGLPRTSSS